MKTNLKLEQVSSQIHEMWMFWAKELLNSEPNLSKERVKRWKEFCFIPYLELSEEMKELDRNFAQKIINKIK